MELHPELAKAFALDGKVAVITGAGSGMGQEAARIFALARAHVVIVDIDPDGLDATAKTVQAAGGQVTSHCVDVSRREAVESLADSVMTTAGRLDVWINAAGVSYVHSILETNEAEAARTVAVNMMGPYWSSMAAGRVMRKQGSGSIINISSSGGSKPVPGLAVYGMTKAAVHSLTWTSAMEFGPFGIRVNAIAPGWIDTPMISKLYRDEAGRIDEEKRAHLFQDIRKSSPLGLIGQVSDIAFALLYLAADASRFVTGQVLRVNGGESM